MLSLYFLHYNFFRQHKEAHRVTPAMDAGIQTTFRDAEWIVGLVDTRAPKPRRPKTYRKRLSLRLGASELTSGTSFNPTRAVADYPLTNVARALHVSV